MILTAHLSSNELLQHARVIVAGVCDPEIPVLSLQDLGVVRDVKLFDGHCVEVELMPTYSGCPAMDVMAQDIERALVERGFERVKITRVLSPAWSTEMITAEGRAKLKEYGIAPPRLLKQENAEVECPLCGSAHTQEISHFGSTPCKALWKCLDCKEPFDLFKCH